MLKAKHPPQRVIDAPLPPRPGGAEGGDDVGVETEGGGDLCHIGLWAATSDLCPVKSGGLFGGGEVG